MLEWCYPRCCLGKLPAPLPTGALELRAADGADIRRQNVEGVLLPPQGGSAPSDPPLAPAGTLRHRPASLLRITAFARALPPRPQLWVSNS
jgi:hypothetical protein